MSDNKNSLCELPDDQPRESADKTANQSVIPEKPTMVSARDLQSYLHDINGPLASARGFTEELKDVRRCMKDLIAKPDIGSDKALMSALQDQIDDEMEYCLDRVERSLVNLDSIVELIRTRAIRNN